MDFTFTEEQQAVVEAARHVFSAVAPDRVPSPALTSGAVADGPDRALWAQLGESDLLGVLVPGVHGGAGLDVVALCLLLRESARVLARVPLLEHAAVAHVLAGHAPADLAAELLPGVARGETVLTAAAHGRTGHDPAELAVTARREDPAGDDAVWVLDGTQTLVPWAHHADWIAVPAHTGEGRSVLALVPPHAPGLRTADQYSTSGERLAELTLDGVRVPARLLLDAEGAWDRLREVLTVGTCALALGLGEQVLSMTADYTGKREQFGHAVATFQAVAVQAADRYIDLKAMEVTLWQAAQRLDRPGEGGPLPATGDLAVAKIWASEGVRRVVQTAQHLHGGFGADTDYSLHRYHAWAKHVELQLGPAAAHEEALGDLLAAHPLT
ncbi:acyl-CoA dehydrogenase family protein [Streptomyces sp. BI20]|uniref:acyl-CoA dehydrogenase family protein n=1 Tax=Streptomyces sp. BI20 TaxID=3403460 RepID=UPI003C70C2BB